MVRIWYVFLLCMRPGSGSDPAAGSRSFRSCSKADSTTGSYPIPLLVHALLLVSARRFLHVVYCFCDAAAVAAARFGFKSAAAACLCDAEDAAAAATRSQLRRRGGRACRIGPIGDAAGDWASNRRNRRPLRRRCRGIAAPFNDAAGELVESKWRFLISMFSPATAVYVVNKLTASSN